MCSNNTSTTTPVIDTAPHTPENIAIQRWKGLMVKTQLGLNSAGDFYSELVSKVLFGHHVKGLGKFYLKNLAAQSRDGRVLLLPMESLGQQSNVMNPSTNFDKEQHEYFHSSGYP